EEVRVFTPAELAGLNPESQAVRIGGSVGNKKRGEIQTRALELGLKVLNAKDLTRAAKVPAESEEEVNEDE
nr:50S ribosomal protein L32e [Methanoculleus sp.]